MFNIIGDKYFKISTQIINRKNIDKLMSSVKNIQQFDRQIFYQFNISINVYKVNKSNF